MLAGRSNTRKESNMIPSKVQESPAMNLRDRMGFPKAKPSAMHVGYQSINRSPKKEKEYMIIHNNALIMDMSKQNSTGKVSNHGKVSNYSFQARIANQRTIRDQKARFGSTHFLNYEEQVEKDKKKLASIRKKVEGTEM